MANILHDGVEAGFAENTYANHSSTENNIRWGVRATCMIHTTLISVVDNGNVDLLFSAETLQVKLTVGITRTLTLEPHTACRKGAGGWLKLIKN